MSQFIEDLLRPRVVDSTIDEGYKAMASGGDPEAEAMEWARALAQDLSCEKWQG